MTNKRQFGRWFFALLALVCTIGCMVAFFDHAEGVRRELQALTMAVLTHALITAIKCLED